MVKWLGISYAYMIENSSFGGVVVVFFVRLLQTKACGNQPLDLVAARLVSGRNPWCLATLDTAILYQGLQYINNAYKKIYRGALLLRNRHTTAVIVCVGRDASSISVEITSCLG